MVSNVYDEYLLIEGGIDGSGDESMLASELL